MIIFGMLGVGGLGSEITSNDQARIEAKVNDLDERLRSVELSSGAPNARDQNTIAGGK